MTASEHFQAKLAKSSTVPTLLCGHCGSILPRGRIFRNDISENLDASCRIVGLCSADDCGALNCCDDALAQLDNPEKIVDMAF
ncbi:MAG: hypothetical protein KGY54_10590 [Oleiphilaceae bacterium]|nr:hypothetical protein [Oleiphilaceae bacterium]